MDKTIKIGVAVLAIVAIAGIAVLFSGLFVQKESATGSAATVYFFYGEECPHCHNIMPFVISMTKKYPDADIRILEVWHNQTNQQLFQQANIAAGMSQAGVPEVIAGKTVLIGEVEIPAKLESIIIESLKKKA
jgi:thiol-disulfide isomerase/thioredoxin